MRRSRVLVGATAVVVVAALGVGWAHARRSEPVRPAYSRTTCLLGSPEVRAATDETLAGLDPGMFSSFRVLEPPPPPLSSDHYRGPLWVWATLAGSRDRRTHDMTGEWEMRLATGAIAERCSLGLPDLQRAVAGGSLRTGVGRPFVSGGSSYSKAGQVYGAQASRESDAQIITRAKAVLRSNGLTPVSVRVLRPLGPALLVEASTDDESSLEGRVPAIENALDGGGWGRHPRFEGVYLAVDGPEGPLVRSGGTRRYAGGFVWAARGFETGFQHG